MTIPESSAGFTAEDAENAEAARSREKGDEGMVGDRGITFLAPSTLRSKATAEDGSARFFLIFYLHTPIYLTDSPSLSLRLLRVLGVLSGESWSQFPGGIE
jgi:hypothetical protein